MNFLSPGYAVRSVPKESTGNQFSDIRPAMPPRAVTAFERKTRTINELEHNNVMANYTNILKKKELFLKEVERVKEDI